MGAPFGTDAYITTFGTTQAEEKAKLLQILPQLPSLQSAWLLLYFCGVPRLNHLLRTATPNQSLSAALLHDTHIIDAFRAMFDIPGHAGWDVAVHGIEYATWVAQAKLPLRLGGLGLRDSQRLAPAAYWASWADSLTGLVNGFPAIGREILHHLQALNAASPDNFHAYPSCLAAAESAGRVCDAAGWATRPSWDFLAAGGRPPEPSSQQVELGVDPRMAIPCGPTY